MSHNLNKLVYILNDGRFHDGDSLGVALQVTRSAIWKMIKKLIDYGIAIESIKGKGYRLEEPLILLDQAQIQASFPNIQIDIFESISSTHTYLKDYFNTKEPRICITEQQTQGKGRLGRSWHSPFGQNIYFSLLHHFTLDLSQITCLSLVISLAINRTLCEYTAPQMTKVKWPNDVLFDRKKLAGTLIEVQAENNSHCSTIIGIGINVNMLNDTNQDITQPWISLRSITQQYIDRNNLCISLMKNLTQYLARFAAEGLNSFIDEWNQHDCLQNREINIQSLEKNIQGKAVGINTRGELLLQDSTGKILGYSSGDTTILK